MFRKLSLALLAAAALGAAAIGGSSESRADPWNHGYHGRGHHYGPPPWARPHHWRRHPGHWRHHGHGWGHHGHHRPHPRHGW